MNGRTAVLSIVIAAGLTAVLVYWLQLYAYYDEVALAPEGSEEIMLTARDSGVAEPIAVRDFQGIDANSSPLRFRACFRVDASLAELSRRYAVVKEPTPLTGPGWFDCYDAETVGTSLEKGEATAFLSERNIADGVDRVIAVYPDGRAFAWHQLNEKYQE